tara:strand:- start:337 stop:483 length:147 start_codon:yes stop_codon:yes gene_type:complete
MAIEVGDKIPEVTLRIKGTKGVETITTEDVFKGKKVAIFGVPGAFTPT